MGKSKNTHEKVSKKRPGSEDKTKCRVCGAGIEGLSEWTTHLAKWSWVYFKFVDGQPVME